MTEVRSCICGSSSCQIPFGTCHCGCGQKTSIAKQTNKSFGHRAGMPTLFLTGHSKKRIRLNSDTLGHFRVDGEYCRLISLGEGFFSVIDEAEYKRISTHLWTPWWNPHTRSFYAVRDEDKHRIYMHREVLGLKEGDGLQVDHIHPLETLDNRKLNLRVATYTQQRANTLPRSNNTSGFKGVSYVAHCRKWKAQLNINGKVTYLGMRTTAEAAYRELYIPAAKAEFGEFARV